MTNQNHESTPSEGITRRNFLRLSLWGGLFIVTLEGIAATIISLWPKAKAGGVGSVIEAGNVGDYKVGTIKYFPEAHFYLSRVENGLLALNRKCTHLGCVVPWQASEKSEDTIAPTGRFNCPCHSGIYDRYGRVTGGPPPRPLDLHPITIEGGKIMVDTGKLLLRQTFDPSQVTKV